MPGRLAANSQGVPAISIANNNKFQGVPGTLGCAVKVVDTRPGWTGMESSMPSTGFGFLYHLADSLM